MAVQNACFLIADISGYTNYLTHVELDHAEDILADLMNAVVTALRPPFRLAKLEGDAAFTYMLGETIDGSLLQDTIERTYFAFRSRLRDIDGATTCQCNACSRMSTLDLKFVVHQGQTIIQTVAGSEELVGSDIILVHRLLKNAVDEKIGGHAYALFTDACLRAAGIDPVGNGLTEHHEEIDALGEVTAWIKDLEAAWQKENELQRILVTREEAALLIEGDTSAPRALVWAYSALPEHRPKWQGSQGVTELHVGGRRGAGTINHCTHGANTVVEHILDWRPQDYFTMTSHIDLPDSAPLTLSIVFADLPDGGTHSEVRIAQPSEEARAFFEAGRATFEANYRNGFEELRKIIENHPENDLVIGEPRLKVPGRRHIDQPVQTDAGE